MLKLLEAITSKKNLLIFAIIYYLLAIIQHQIACYTSSIDSIVTALPINNILFSENLSQTVTKVFKFEIAFTTILFSAVLAITAIFINNFTFKLISFLSSKALFQKMSEYLTLSHSHTFVTNFDHINLKKNKNHIKRVLNFSSLLLALLFTTIINNSYISSSKLITITLTIFYALTYLYLMYFNVRYFLPSLLSEQQKISSWQEMYFCLRDLV